MFDVLILAGGSGRRLGGVDKPGLVVGGRSMLDRVLTAAEGAVTTVVVGPQRPTYRPVVWTREDVVGGGPVAALAAGMEQVEAARVVLLAADLPFLSADLVSELAGHGNVVVTDGNRPQWLCGAWDAADLRRALIGIDPVGARLRDVLAPLQPTLLTVAGDGWQDVDTEEDLARVRSWA